MAFWEPMPDQCWNRAFRLAWRMLGWGISAAIAFYFLLASYDSMKVDFSGFDRDKIVARYSPAEGQPKPDIKLDEQSMPPNMRPVSSLKNITPEQKERALKTGLSPDEILRVLEEERLESRTDPFLDELRGAGRMPHQSDVAIWKANWFMLVPWSLFLLLGVSLIIQNVMAGLANGMLAIISYNRGRLADAGVDCEKAIVEYRRAVELSGGQDSSMRLGLALHKAGRTEEALRVLEAVLKGIPDRKIIPGSLAHTAKQVLEELRQTARQGGKGA
jgi:hypothetical protein